METKTKMNSVLEKKVEELESLLETTTRYNDIDPNLYRKIQLRILFANTLLAAEISSRPMDVEGEEDDEETLKFASMAKRLTELTEVFNINQLPSDDNDDASIEPDIESLETDVGIVKGETDLVYSLVESCLNESIKAEEEKAEKEDVEAEQWPLFEDAFSEEKTEVTFPVVTAVKEEPVVEEKRLRGFRTLVCFSLIGLVCGMIGLFGCISTIMQEDIVFPTPT